ncbi:MAG: potassium channel family protein [Thermodesulfobacteriota bacterium]|nr:potassium channel family protein [Thermodesulfobacteriota bacterium]
MLILVTIAWTEGYHLLEGWSLANSFYATIVTLGTVGFGDFYPVTPAGKLFAIFIIVFGVGTMASYLVGSGDKLIALGEEANLAEFSKTYLT